MELYRSRAYDPKLVARRYVAWRPSEERFVIFEVNANSLTLREVASDGTGIPEGVRKEAEGSAGRAFSQVLWEG